MTLTKMLLGNLALCTTVSLVMGLDPARVSDLLILALVSAVGWAACLET